MAEWRERGYVPDSDDEEEGLDLIRRDDQLTGNKFDGKPGSKDTGPDRSEGSSTLRTSILAAPSTGNHDFIQLADGQLQDLIQPKDDSAGFSHQPGSEQNGSLSDEEIEGHDHVLPIPDSAAIDHGQVNETRASVSEQLQLELNSGLDIIKEILSGSSATAEKRLDDESGLSSPLSSVESSSGEDHYEKRTTEAASERPSVVDNQTSAQSSVQSVDKRPIHTANLASGAQLKRRNLRQRNPIQLHPYALEGARYQQELLARGLKPVHWAGASRQVSPGVNEPPDDDSGESKAGNDVEDTASSQQDSLGVLQPISNNAVRKLAKERSADAIPSDEELPDLDAILEGRPCSLPQIRKRSKRIYKAPRAAKNRTDDTDFHVYELPSDSAGFTLGGNQDSATFHVPPSPPRSHSLRSSQSNEAFPGLLTRKHFADRVTPQALPTPIISSTTQQLTALPFDVDEDLESSESDIQGLSRSSSPHSFGQKNRQILQFQRKTKGVLPASFFRLHGQQDNARTNKVRERSLSSDRDLDVPGVAHRLYRPVNVQKSPPQALNNSILVSDEFSSDEIFPAERSRHPAAMHSSARYDDVMVLLGSDIEEDDSVDVMVQPRSRKRRLTHSAKRQRRVSEFGYEIFDHSGGEPSRRRSLKRQRGPDPKDAGGRRRNRKTSRAELPSLGPLDAPGYRNLPRVKQPRFLRVAARRARSHRASGRQSPSRKYIRLATVADTQDANSELSNWRKGLLEQNAKMSSNAVSHIPAQRHELGLDQPVRPEPPGTLNSASATIDGLPPTTDGRGQAEHRSAPRRQTEDVIEEMVRRQTTYADRQSNDYSVPFLRSSDDSTLSRLRHPAPLHSKYRNRSGRGMLLSSSTSFTKPREAQFESLVQLRSRDRVRSAFQGSLISSRPTSVAYAATEVQIYRQPPQHLEGSGSDTLFDDVSLQALPRPLRKRPPKRANIPTLTSLWQPDPLGDVSNPDNDSLDQLSGVVLAGLGSPEYSMTNDFGVVPFIEGTCLHETSFVGQGHLYQLMRNLTLQPRKFIRFTNEVHVVMRPSIRSSRYRWGVWNDQVSQEFSAWFMELRDCLSFSDHQVNVLPSTSRQNTLAAVSSLISYLSCHVSFLDSQSLIAFAENAVPMVQELALQAEGLMKSKSSTISPDLHRFSYLVLILVFEIARIDSMASLNRRLHTGLQQTSKALALEMLKTIIREDHVAKILGLSTAGHDVPSIRSEYPEIDALVVINHLSKQNIFQIDIWDLITEALVASIGIHPENLVTFQDYDCWWRWIFLLLPLLELDASGLLQRRSGFSGWDLVQRLLVRFISLFMPRRYQAGYTTKIYGRILVQRCFDLVCVWGWQGGHSAIGTIFDAYSSNDLQDLFGETPEHSFCIPVNLAPGIRVQVDRTDSGFHAFLALLAQTILDAQGADADQKLSKRVLRSLSARLVPTHGGTYVRDEKPNLHTLVALRNRFDLVSVMYCAMPTELKPSLRLFQSLVDVRTAHREASRTALECWSQLVQHALHVEGSLSAVGQKADDDQYLNVLPSLREWHDAIVMALLHGYNSKSVEILGPDEGHPTKNAKTRGGLSDMRKPTAEVLKETLKASEQSFGICRHAEQATDLFSHRMVGEVLKLFNPEDPAQNILVSAALHIVRAYTQKCGPQTSHNTSADEDSQEYGSWDHFDAMVIDEQDRSTPDEAQCVYLLDEVRPMLRRFFSNVFGSDAVPDHAILKNTADCWYEIADALVRAKTRSWDDFVGQYSTDSWESLRQTQQSQQYRVYFLAKVVDSDHGFYKNNRLHILGAWISALCRPESLLCWEHLLTSILLFHDSDNELLFNPPFAVRSDADERLEIPMVELRQRRTVMIYAVLRNMHRLLAMPLMSLQPSLPYGKEDFSFIVGNIESTMKNCYNDLEADSPAQIEYRAFINFVVQQMQLYVVDFHKIDLYFTDPSISSAEASAVTTALRRYSLNIETTGVTKSMVLFLYNASERASVYDNQEQFIFQLESAFLDLSQEAVERTENHESDVALLTLFLQDVFTAYVGHAFSGPGHIVGGPLLRVLTHVYQNLRCRCDIWTPSSLQRLVLATEAIFCGAINAFQSCEPEIILASSPRLDNFTELVIFVHAAMLRMYEAAQAFPDSIDPSNFIECLLLLKDQILAVEQPPNADTEFLDLVANENLIANLSVEKSAVRLYAEKELQNALDKTWRPSPEGGWEIISRDSRKMVKASRRSTSGVSEEEEKRAQCRQRTRFVVEEFVDAFARLDWWE
jgi:Mus7/MMS22 family